MQTSIMLLHSLHGRASRSVVESCRLSFARIHHKLRTRERPIAPVVLADTFRGHAQYCSLFVMLRAFPTFPTYFIAAACTYWQCDFVSDPSHKHSNACPILLAAILPTFRYQRESFSQDPRPVPSSIPAESIDPRATSLSLIRTKGTFSRLPRSDTVLYRSRVPILCPSLVLTIFTVCAVSAPGIRSHLGDSSTAQCPLLSESWPRWISRC